MYLNGNEKALFSRRDWFDVERNQKILLEEEVASMDENRLLNTSVDDLCTYLIGKYSIDDVPTLRPEEIAVDQRETQIDVSRDPMRFVFDRSRPAYVTGTEIEYSVPFDGDRNVFDVRPTTYTLNPPRGHIVGGELRIYIRGIDLAPDAVTREFDTTLSQIEGHLQTLRSDTSKLSAQLPSVARNSIESRRKKLLSDQNLVSSLSYNIKQREGISRTYVAPEVRRKVTATLPPASSEPYKPEPELPLNEYEHILEVIQNMALVIERSPSAFATMDEESLRTHILVQLNGHYEGQATGETFNFEGKTDILIRSEGKNIFIAECKFWNGPKKLAETIDQLLGYSSWRDTKVAVIIFNRNKDFTNVLASLDETTKQHSNFKRELGKQSETSFQYLFAHRDDPNREMVLTVVAFDVPI
jgi:hypothetical protein